MRGISIILFIGFICGIVKIIDLKKENAILRDNTKNDKVLLRCEINSLSERLTVYYLITLEQNNIIDEFRSSRIAKSKNEKLTKLMQKL